MIKHPKDKNLRSQTLSISKATTMKQSLLFFNAKLSSGTRLKSFLTKTGKHKRDNVFATMSSNEPELAEKGASSEMDDG